MMKNIQVLEGDENIWILAISEISGVV